MIQYSLRVNEEEELWVSGSDSVKNNKLKIYLSQKDLQYGAIIRLNLSNV